MIPGSQKLELKSGLRKDLLDNPVHPLAKCRIVTYQAFSSLECLLLYQVNGVPTTSFRLLFYNPIDLTVKIGFFFF